MKMKLFKQFVNEANDELTEGVKIVHNRYIASHGKAPKGFGKWAFSYDRKGDDPIFVPTAMTFTDAVKWIKDKAAEDKKDEVFVMEGLQLDEATDSEMREAIRAAEERSIILRDKETEIRDKAAEATEKGDDFQERMLQMDLRKNRLQQQIAQIDIEKLQQKYRRNNE
jgi:hypothetical protein